MKQLDKEVIFMYSVYSLIKISGEDSLKFFDVLEFMGYLKNIYPEIKIFNNDEIIKFLNKNQILRLHVNQEGRFCVCADKNKLDEYINENKMPFLINLYNKSEVFVWDKPYKSSDSLKLKQN